MLITADQAVNIKAFASEPEVIYMTDYPMSGKDEYVIHTSTAYTLSDVNIRREPDTESGIVCTERAFSPVEVVDGTAKDGWQQVIINDTIFYISTEFIGSKEKAEEKKEYLKKVRECPFSQTLSDRGIGRDLQQYYWDLATVRYPEFCEEKKRYYASLIGVTDCESTFNPRTVSRTNDYGLMQVNICNKKKFRELGYIDSMEDMLNDPKTAVRCGEYMWWDCYSRYGFSEASYGRYYGFWTNPYKSNKKTQRAWRLMQEWYETIWS